MQRGAPGSRRRSCAARTDPNSPFQSVIQVRFTSGLPAAHRPGRGRSPSVNCEFGLNALNDAARAYRLHLLGNYAKSLVEAESPLLKKSQCGPVASLGPEDLLWLKSGPCEE